MASNAPIPASPPPAPHFANSETPASPAAPPPSFPAYDKAPPTRNAPAPPANSASRSKAAWSKLSRPPPDRPPTKPLSRVHTASPAYPASTGRRAKVPLAPHAPYPAPATPRPDGKRPRRFPAAAWSASGILLPLSPIEKRQHKLRPAQGELPAALAAVSRLHCILFQHPASAAARSSSPPSPGEPAPSPDKPPVKCQSTA